MLNSSSQAIAHGDPVKLSKADEHALLTASHVVWHGLAVGPSWMHSGKRTAQRKRDASVWQVVAAALNTLKLSIASVWLMSARLLG